MLTKKNPTFCAMFAMASGKGLILVPFSASIFSFDWHLVKTLNGVISNKSNRNESIYAII